MLTLQWKNWHWQHRRETVLQKNFVYKNQAASKKWPNLCSTSNRITAFFFLILNEVNESSDRREVYLTLTVIYCYVKSLGKNLQPINVFLKSRQQAQLILNKLNFNILKNVKLYQYIAETEPTSCLQMKNI